MLSVCKTQIFAISGRIDLEGHQEQRGGRREGEDREGPGLLTSPTPCPGRSGETEWSLTPASLSSSLSSATLNKE